MLRFAAALAVVALFAVPARAADKTMTAKGTVKTVAIDSLTITDSANKDWTFKVDSEIGYGVTTAGRHLVVRTSVPDRPGELLKLLQLVAEERVNVLSVEHRREGVDIPVGATGIDLTLLTRDEAHCEALLDQMRGWGYEVERLR